MNNDSRVLSNLYRQQMRSERITEQIGVEAQYSQGTEEISQLFDQLIEQKSLLVNNLAVSTTFLGYKHETLKSAINVV
ncbi:hypothetical protein [Pseudomonas sp.]|uniref:hypothetical protein n=1 Tax=Pseudomonas sp. TaxID=306 RepID=UPI003C69094C